MDKLKNNNRIKREDSDRGEHWKAKLCLNFSILIASTKLEGEIKMSSEAAYDDNEFYNQLIVKLKDDQYESGEFGKNSHKKIKIDNLKNRQANSYITWYTIELLNRIDPSCPQIENAIKWFISNISSEGYFMNDDVMVYRHTAGALIALLSIEGITEKNRTIIRQMIENFLTIKNPEEGWRNSSSSEKKASSQLLSTIFVIRALTTCELDYVLNQTYTQAEREKKKQEIEDAIDDGISLLIKKGNDEPNIMITASLIRTNSSIFGSEKYQEFSKSLISKLHDQFIEKIQQNKEGTVDILTSSSILSALFSIRKYIPIDFDIYEFRKVLKKNVLDSKEGIDGLDSLALCFLIDIFSEDCVYRKT